MKISIIGAGNVGATLAERVLSRNLSDVALIDVAADMAKAKAFDLQDAGPIMGYEKSITGGGDYSKIKGSSIIVVTAGFPRKPGMSREDLINKNLDIIRDVAKNVKLHAPDAIVVIVTNPLDIMTYMANKEIGAKRGRVFGMAGTLDSSRFKSLLSEETKIPCAEIDALVLGSHGDTMVPLASQARVNGKPISGVLDKKTIDGIVERTKKRGGEIVGLLKSGSAYFSPSAGVFEILESVIKDKKKILPCSCVMDGEYGIKDCSIGVPARIGKNGVEEIIELELSGPEKDALTNSAAAVKTALNKL